MTLAPAGAPPTEGGATATTVAPPKAGAKPLHKRDKVTGWLFASPVIIGLLVFLAIPIVLTLWVSFRDWSGLGSPFKSKSVGFDNYRELLIDKGIRRKDFAISIRNTFYYVLIVVPVQTFLAMFLAFLVNQKFLKGRGGFRTLLYFPSVTSSIAITLIWTVLFLPSGLVNKILPFDRIDWFDEPNGLLHNLFGVFGMDKSPGWAKHQIFELSIWDWFSGPSVSMFTIMLLTIWTTSGTMMLIFLGGLQNIASEIEEAAVVDGASWWRRFRYVIIPMLRPQIYLAMTLGVIGTWQVFDQVYASANAGGPQKTTLTPAFLVYNQAFDNSKAGLAAATAVILFVIILIFTWLQRRVTGRSSEAV